MTAVSQRLAVPQTSVKAPYTALLYLYVVLLTFVQESGEHNSKANNSGIVRKSCFAIGPRRITVRVVKRCITTRADVIAYQRVVVRVVSCVLEFWKLREYNYRGSLCLVLQLVLDVLRQYRVASLLALAL
eukprot:gb/GECG01016439.1/.p1 GENE.gb/GECG01016439.1/~~gb/GECG01016439.1/.p1  ORF type:complete len:130 (+),score=0.42 gb/GECG01016439.1/:1-390(+)